MTDAEARFSNSLRPRKPEGSLGRTAQDGHLDSLTQLLNYELSSLLCLGFISGARGFLIPFFPPSAEDYGGRLVVRAGKGCPLGSVRCRTCWETGGCVWYTQV